MSEREVRTDSSAMTSRIGMSPDGSAAKADVGTNGARACSTSMSLSCGSVSLYQHCCSVREDEIAY